MRTYSNSEINLLNQLILKQKLCKDNTKSLAKNIRLKKKKTTTLKETISNPEPVQ